MGIDARALFASEEEDLNTSRDIETHTAEGMNPHRQLLKASAPARVRNICQGVV